MFVTKYHVLGEFAGKSIYVEWGVWGGWGNSKQRITLYKINMFRGMRFVSILWLYIILCLSVSLQISDIFRTIKLEYLSKKMGIFVSYLKKNCIKVLRIISFKYD